MKSLVLTEMYLMSSIEKKGKMIQFHPKTTVIKGQNDTGKSSLLKSIYSAFGANPAVIHPKWKSANVVTLVKFNLDRKGYSILQNGKFYAVFDSNDDLLGTFDSITEGLGPFLADLFDFRIELTDHNNRLIHPPPAYLILPFYIDQDKGWAKSWSSFANLTQIPHWKKPIVEYHSGLKPNEYYVIKAKIDSVNSQIKEIATEENILKRMYRKIEEEIKSVDFSIDIDSFKLEIEELLAQCEVLRKLEEDYKVKLTRFYNAKISTEEQIKIVQSSLKELKSDYDYATNILNDDCVSCPTCGATYSNSFAERFSIAKDEDRCHELLLILQNEQLELTLQINKLQQMFEENKTDLNRLTEILEKKQGQVRLRDLIESQGRLEYRKTLRTEITIISGNKHAKEDEVKDLTESLKKCLDKKRQADILKTYRNLMRSYLHELDVHTLTEESFKSIHGEIKETGSDLPRALLAYYYSFLNVMKSYSSSTFLPIVIDSPNQQDQDPVSLNKMLTFIKDKQPSDSQLILGLGDLAEVEFDGDIIELNNKHSLLQEEQYKSAWEKIKPFLDKCLLEN